MTHAVQVELICDLCETRFVGRTEAFPNTRGKTKGTPLVEVRQEAAEEGWSRLRLPGNTGIAAQGIRRIAMMLDCCPACSRNVKSSLEHLRHFPFWFETKKKPASAPS